ncbi:MAG: hypothetical protein K0R43_409 [Pseudoduganella sp.]|nr:hypothetical protein [Pseudoduganella sp.]
MCFQMQNDALNRYYVAVQDNNEPFGTVASREARAIRLYEYHVSPHAPVGQQFVLQTSLSGTASFSPDGSLQGLAAGTVTGLDGSSGAVFTTRIEQMGGQWSASRSTFTGSATMHQLAVVSCGATQ